MRNISGTRRKSPRPHGRLSGCDRGDAIVGVLERRHRRSAGQGFRQALDRRCACNPDYRPRPTGDVEWQPRHGETHRISYVTTHGCLKNDNTGGVIAAADPRPMRSLTDSDPTKPTGSGSTARITRIPIDGEFDKGARLAEGRLGHANDTQAVAPLTRSDTDIARASRLLAGRNRHGASQVLRQAQDPVLYDADVAHDVVGSTTSASAWRSPTTSNL